MIRADRDLSRYTLQREREREPAGEDMHTTEASAYNERGCGKINPNHSNLTERASLTERFGRSATRCKGVACCGGATAIASQPSFFFNVPLCTLICEFVCNGKVINQPVVSGGGFLLVLLEKPTTCCCCFSIIAGN